ncbi:alpha-1,3-mannosyl-glycoprotein 4-beta-N-acetylglucosaminyltransferase A-like isoform X2 [Actinia tenebrosa]|uniref:Alpha-1,3-mannosyl-glycoprotein 4-beta-N-acetylglucosaminyltransferase A-like isoform X2 n=1 Tax=Actinia tenebrosa TaxID=6105 RepID=A0A6P8H381_ACTTE|nr:alpha-1,3-mannosyl-glycoprotein 4-beta-N-acetylglucosaminyltransferase A-like isoform X2 [Actinia tenebrosa]
MRRSKRTLAKCLLFGGFFIILANITVWLKTSGFCESVTTEAAKKSGFGESVTTKAVKTSGFGESNITKAAKTRAFLVIGVPTVRRPKAASYLSQTLKELVEGLEEHEKSEVLILVFITDFNTTVIQSIRKEISDSFANEMNSGLLRVVTAPRSFYPSLENLPRLWGDSPERVKWRSKQCLDYAFLFEYSKDLGEYYLQIEDDISTSKGYLKAIKNFITTNEKRAWSVLEFGARGFIGIMYRTTDIGRLSMFVKSFFWVLPIDILNRYFNDFHLHGNPAWARCRPPIFRHVGTFSSLVGQVRPLEDIKTTDRIYKDSHNPHAEVNTSIISYNRHNITAAYDTTFHGMFWGKNIKIGDYILVHFYTPARVSRLIVESVVVVVACSSEGGLVASVVQRMNPDPLK